MREIWKDVKGLEGKYQVSNFGRVKSLHYNQKNYSKVLKPQTNRCGYQTVNIGKKVRTIHRLVAIAFIPNPKELCQVNHKDGNKTNNHVQNLEWCSVSENNLHAYRTGLKKATSDHLKKRINQYDKDGNFIKEWESTKEIERELGIHHSNITACCKGKLKTCGNYVWRYA